MADAGPLIALASIGAIELLRQLFGRVCITNTIRDEILPAGCVFPDADLIVRSLSKGGSKWLRCPRLTTSCSTLVLTLARRVPLKRRVIGAMEATRCSC